MTAALPFQLHRLGVIMRGDADNPDEALGVLNPATARAPDGKLYMFPRVVAAGNYSRVGIAEIIFDAAGEPNRVERRGYALEPTESYEQNARTAGCEDARITYVEPLRRYLMTYTAYGPSGPRIALAESTDLLRWERLSYGGRLTVLATTALAAFGGIFMAVNFHVANGAPHPWLVPKSGFDEGVDLDSLLPLVQLVLIERRERQ